MASGKPTKRPKEHRDNALDPRTNTEDRRWELRGKPQTIGRLLADDTHIGTLMGNKRKSE